MSNPLRPSAPREEGDSSSFTPVETRPMPSAVQDDEASETSSVRVVDKRWWVRETDSDDASEHRTSKPSYVEDLERQLDDKNKLLKSYASKYKESAAEFEKTRVRLRREIAKDVEREKRNVLVSFLEVIDNLDRALEAGQDVATQDALLKGVEMVRAQFLSALDDHGVARIKAGGKPFDPNFHDAISTVPVNDPTLHDVIIDIIKIGYRLEDEVLRPASVTVGRYDSSNTATSHETKAET